MKFHLIRIVNLFCYNLRLFILYWTHRGHRNPASKWPRWLELRLCSLWAPIFFGSVQAKWCPGRSVGSAGVRAVIFTHPLPRYCLSAFLVLTQGIGGFHINIFILKMRKWRHRKVRSLAKFSQPVRGVFGSRKESLNLWSRTSASIVFCYYGFVNFPDLRVNLKSEYPYSTSSTQWPDLGIKGYFPPINSKAHDCQINERIFATVRMSQQAELLLLSWL